MKRFFFILLSFIFFSLGAVLAQDEGDGNLGDIDLESAIDIANLTKDEAFEDATGATPEEDALALSESLDKYVESASSGDDSILYAIGDGMSEYKENMTNATKNSLNEFLKAFTPQNLMPELPELARQWRVPFYGLTALIFIGTTISVLSRFKFGNPDATQSGLRLVIAIFAAVNVPLVMNMAIGTVDRILEVGADKGVIEVDMTNPWALADNLTDLAWTFTQVDITQGEPLEQIMVAASVNAEPDGTATKSIRQRFSRVYNGIKDKLEGGVQAVGEVISSVNPVEATKDFLAEYNPFIVLKRFFYAIVITVCAYATALIAAIIVMGFDFLRYLFLHVGSIVLPLAIAAATTNIMRNQGISYIFSMIGVAAWPIGWVFVNIIAYTLQKVQVRLLNAKFLLVDSDELGASLANSIGSTVFTLGLDSLGLIMLLQVLVVATIIGGYLTACIIIQRFVTSGGMIAPAIMATGMQWAGKTGGAMGSVLSSVPGLGAAGKAMSAVSNAAGTALSTASRSVDDSPPIVQTSGRPIQSDGGAMDGVGAMPSSVSPSSAARQMMNPIGGISRGRR